jgi:hypothetical protein
LLGDMAEERFHTLEDLKNETFDETRKFIKKSKVYDEHQDERGYLVSEEAFLYQIFKKNDYIAHGYYAHNHDHFRDYIFVTEIVYPFNEQGYLEPIMKRRIHNVFFYWESEAEEYNKFCIINKKIKLKLQAKWKQYGINFDLSHKRIVSWV